MKFRYIVAVFCLFSSVAFGFISLEEGEKNDDNWENELIYGGIKNEFPMPEKEEEEATNEKDDDDNWENEFLYGSLKNEFPISEKEAKYQRASSEPVNEIEKTVNNYFFYIVQNFNFDHHNDEDQTVTTTTTTVAPHKPQQLCGIFHECQAKNERCIDGKCKKVRLCKFDRECYPPPTTWANFQQYYCASAGYCRMGVRTCYANFQCQIGGKCVANRCVAAETSPTTTTNSPPAIIGRRCFSSWQCRISGLPFPTMIGQCVNGYCRFIAMPTSPPPTVPSRHGYRTCNQAEECYMGLSLRIRYDCIDHYCVGEFVGPFPHTTPPSELQPTSEAPCQYDYECLLRYGFRHFFSYECQNHRCIFVKEAPATLPNPVNTKPLGMPCNDNLECRIRYGISSFFGYECQNHRCIAVLNSPRTTPLPTTPKPPSSQPLTCVTNYDCALIARRLPQTPTIQIQTQCLHRHCVWIIDDGVAIGNGTTFTPPPPKNIPCKTDEFCENHYTNQLGHYKPTFVIGYCNDRGFCQKGIRPRTPPTPTPTTTTTMKPKPIEIPCKTDAFCTRLYRIPFHIHRNGNAIFRIHPRYGYCEDGFCRRGRRPYTTPAPSTTTTTKSTPAKVPCKTDAFCANYYRHRIPSQAFPNIIGTFVYPSRGYCDHGFCRRGSRGYTIPTSPKTTTTSKPTTKPTPTKVSCKTDAFCVNYYRSQMDSKYGPIKYGTFFHHSRGYCDHGFCRRGYRPFTTPTPPTTTTTLKPTTKKSEQKIPCKTDAFCDNHYRMGRLYRIIYGYCDNGFCRRGRRSPFTISTPPTTTLKSTQESTSTGIITSTTTTKPTTSTKKPLKKIPCTTDEFCSKYYQNQVFPKGIKIRKTGYCSDRGFCMRGLKPQKRTTTTTTVKPEESSTGYKDTTFDNVKCNKTDVKYCEKYAHEHIYRGFLIYAYCNDEGYCQIGKPTTHTPAPTQKLPEIPSSTGEYLPDFPLKTSTFPSTVDTEKSTTPKIYHCRRNADCLKMPRPENMPVHCGAHHICKHGNRRPTNDFDACKKDEDCPKGGKCKKEICYPPS